MNAHEFALYMPELSKLVSNAQVSSKLTIVNSTLVQRIKNILRLRSGEQCILFDAQYHTQVVIESLGKEILTKVIRITKNKPLQPTIICLLPLLKREALNDAIYAATELGATEIQLVVTQKSAHSKTTARAPAVPAVASEGLELVKLESLNERRSDLERFQKIIIAAAEQSKNFTIPILSPPELLSDSLDKLVENTRIFFDPHGEHLGEIITQLQKKEVKNIVVLIGPEGDLTNGEKELLKKSGFTFCALTQTVLRAPQALTVGLGALRSILKGHTV